MIASIVGNYLKEAGLITEEQFYDLMLEHKRVRVKLGLIAVAEGLMTQEEADRVNRLQAVMDMRFGDIAVEKGYLTEGQLETLLKKQGNAYLALAQALENQRLINVSQLNQCMVDFQYDNHFMDSDMEILKNDDIEQIVKLYLPLGGVTYQRHASIALRTLMRLVDNDVCIKRPYLAIQCEEENGALQCVEGENGFTCGMFGKGAALRPAATVFGQEEFEAVDADALDAIGELLNCINGLIATEFSYGGAELELCPPEFSEEMWRVTAKEMLVLPLILKGRNVDLIITKDNSIKIQ